MRARTMGARLGRRARRLETSGGDANANARVRVRVDGKNTRSRGVDARVTVWARGPGVVVAGSARVGWRWISA